MSKNDLSSLTKKELLDLARDRDLPGRSKMDKDELVAALDSSGKPRRARAAAKTEVPPRAAKSGSPRTTKPATPKAAAPKAAAEKTEAPKAAAPKAAAKGAAPKAAAEKAAAEKTVAPKAAAPKAAAERTPPPKVADVESSRGAESEAPRAANGGGGRVPMSAPKADPTPPSVDGATASASADQPQGDRPRGDRSQGDRSQGDRDQGRDGRGRRGRRRGRGRDERGPGPVVVHGDDDSDPWNRIDGADPNYGRFLNPQTADFRRGGARHGRSANGANRPAQDRKPGGRNQDRAQQARDTMRRSGEARSGVSYTPMFERSNAGDDSRGGSNRSRRSRRREERRRRNAEGRTENVQQNPRRQDGAGGANRPSVDLPRVWKEDVARREDYHRAREGRGGRDGRPDAQQDGAGRSRRESARDLTDGRQTARGEHGAQDEASLDAIGVIGPVDPNHVQGEIRSMRQRGDGRQGPAEPSRSKCRVLPRDPYHIHVFWELDEDHVYKTASALEVPFEDLRWVLRVHSLPPEVQEQGSQPPGFFDVEIEGGEQSTYVHVGLADRDYRVDIGLLTDRGLFCPLASSNRVRTPRDSAERAEDPATAEVAAKFYEESGGSPAPRIEHTEPPVLQRNLEASRRPSGGDVRGGRDGDVRGSVDGAHGGGATALATEPGMMTASTATSPGAAPSGGAVSQPVSAGLAHPTVTSPGAKPTDADLEARPTSPSARPTSPGARPTSPGAQPGWVTSPGARPSSPTGPISSPHARPTVQGPQPNADRGFWLAVQTELVVSGITEPDAKVTIQGISIPVRPDGTFTVRFELPDGEQIVPVIAVSRDGMFEKEITPRVTRSTTKSERILGEVEPGAGDDEPEASAPDEDGEDDPKPRGRGAKGRAPRRGTGRGRSAKS